jgi:Domain of unknown function (DUF4365)
VEISQRQEQFSKAYVQAVAATAGYSCTTPVVDDDSVDVTIAARGARDTIRSPRLDAQVKSWTAPRLVDDDLRYPLGIKNYNDLRHEDYLVPRILIVVVMPANLDDWVELSHDQTIVRRCGYWTSLRRMGPTMNTDSVTVTVPTGQQLTVEALTSLMERIGAGGLP